MEIIKSDIGGVLDKAVMSLKNGGIIVHHTDTCYGLACDPFNEEALTMLYSIKKMSLDKPVSVFVDSVEMAEEYSFLSDVARKILLDKWPCSLTLISSRTDALPEFLNSSVDTVGMRWPDHEFCVGLVKGLGRPVVTTSANISGQKEVYDVDTFLVQLGEEMPDLIVDNGRQIKNKPSTIVRIVGAEFKILRQGGIVLGEDVD